MSSPRLLVFDLDGTLVDSSTDLCNSVNAALAHLGRSPLPEEVIAGYVGDGAAMLVRRALVGSPGSDGGEDDESTFATVLTFFLTYYRAHKLDNTRAHPGVLEALCAIRQAHPQLPMAVLTNKPVGPSRGICDALGLSPFFFQNYGGDSFITKKPDPTGLLTLIGEAQDLLGSGTRLSPKEVVMIGDSDVDVLTARRAGTQSLGCLYGLSPIALAAVQPDHSVEHASEWQRVLGL